MKFTVTQLRKDTREIFDAVDRGEEVRIIRYDKEYILVPGYAAETVKGFFNKESTNSTGELELEAASTAVKFFKKGSKQPKPENACPHGYAKGMCKYADCNKKFKGSKK